jgi:glycosyltransferase involved in cell wall biosynthesis
VSRLLVALRAWPDLPVEVVEADANFRNMAGPLADALRERLWPVVAVVQSHAARFVRYMPEPAVRVLVLHDVKALVHSRRAAIAASRWRRWRLEREAARYHRFEREACRWYDVVVTVSDVDADYVRTEYGADHVVTRRLPIDSAYWTPRCVPNETGLILFTGLMNHPPNVDAAVFMARTIMPLVRAAVPEACFRVVGRHPSPEVMALASLPGIEVTGEVADVRPHVEQACVVVVPLRFGSGARQKILEAWAMQKCVVSTTIGAEGLGAQDGEHLAIADSPRAFADTVIRALEDASWRESLSRRGRTIVTTSHDPAAIARRYAADLGAVVGARRAERQADAMRIAVDMRWMAPGLAGGIEQVASSFVRELLALDRHNRYTLLLPAAAAARFDVRKNPNVRITSPDGAGAYLRMVGRRARRAVLGAVRLDDWRTDQVRQLEFVRALDAEMV